MTLPRNMLFMIGKCSWCCACTMGVKVACKNHILLPQIRSFVLSNLDSHENIKYCVVKNISFSDQSYLGKCHHHMPRTLIFLIRTSV